MTLYYEYRPCQGFDESNPIFHFVISVWCKGSSSYVECCEFYIFAALPPSSTRLHCYSVCVLVLLKGWSESKLHLFLQSLCFSLGCHSKYDEEVWVISGFSFIIYILRMSRNKTIVVSFNRLVKRSNSINTHPNPRSMFQCFHFLLWNSGCFHFW